MTIAVCLLIALAAGIAATYYFGAIAGFATIALILVLAVIVWVETTARHHRKQRQDYIDWLEK